MINASNVSVWRGQYYLGDKFQKGTFLFNFTVYDAKSGGEICYSNTSLISTNDFGEWETEETHVGKFCNNSDYFLKINIDGKDQIQRKRLIIWDYLRKDVDETSSANNLKLGSGDDSDVSLTLFHDKVGGHTFSIKTLATSVSSSAHSVVFENAYCGDTIYVNKGADNFLWGLYIDGNFTPLMQLNSLGELGLPQNGINMNDNNITNVSSGFFSFLGSLTNRINELFVQNINFNGTIVGEGSINTSKNIFLSGNLTKNSGCKILSSTFSAEDSTNINDGLEYSYGDGNKNGLGPRQPCSGRIIYLMVQAEKAVNGNGIVGIVINGSVTSPCNISTPSSNGASTFTTCNMEFNQGDHLTPRTLIIPSQPAQNNGYIVTWWVNYD